MNNILLDHNIEDYISSLEVNAATHELYEKNLHYFKDWAIRHYRRSFRDFKSATGFVRDYKRYLVERKEIKANVVNNYIAPIRGYLKYKYGYDVAIRCMRLPEYHLRDSLQKTQIRELYSQINIDVLKGKRDLSIFKLCVSCGLRSHELVNIKFSDMVNRNGRFVIYILGKGRRQKDEFVVPNQSAIDALSSYMSALRNKFVLGDDSYVFVSLSNHGAGHKITTRGVRYIVDKYLISAGLKGTGRYSTHSLRHSTANIAFDNGADIRVVKRLMRHKSLGTTQIYIDERERLENGAENLIDV